MTLAELHPWLIGFVLFATIMSVAWFAARLHGWWRWRRTHYVRRRM